MDKKKQEHQKQLVKEAYGEIAKADQEKSPCCSFGVDTRTVAKKIGYSEEELKAVPEEANLGLGCGNPTAIAGLQSGDIVLDLGSGAGFDCFLAALKVGEKGKVIGVDMTPAMIEKATTNAKNSGYQNVEFRLGELEKLPVDDNSIDVVISNCVINLVPDKKKVFEEVYRVLKPGGRMCVSDIVLKKDLPEYVKNSKSAYVACIAGAIKLDQYLALIKKAGFSRTRVAEESSYSCLFEDTPDPLGKKAMEEFGVGEELRNVIDLIVSAKIEAFKE